MVLIGLVKTIPQLCSVDLGQLLELHLVPDEKGTKSQFLFLSVSSVNHVLESLLIRVGVCPKVFF